MQAVPLPDISRAAEAVQAQLREQHAKMTRVGGAGRSRRPADRAAAYGEMGKLFIATEFYDAAERCFQNARALAPGDMRWPYYLAHVARLADDPAKAADALRADAWPLQPDHVPSLVWLAEMHLAQSQPARAKPLLLKAHSLAPREAAVLYGLGRVALEERDYARRGEATSRRRWRWCPRPAASSIRWRWRIAASATRRRPRRTCGCAARWTCRRPTA